MERLIPVINKIQEVFKKTGGDKHKIELPQIVVVGSQSSGKSSVLESLVGNSFLPRGTEIVTRCPTILQLTPIDKAASGQDLWYCVFDHDPDTQFTDVDKIRLEIENQTDILADHKEKGISDTPIIINVFSTKVIPLTVVDLPGIVKNPVGDQPDDIEEQVHKLIMTYISNPNAIILAVSPANTDIATSESIKLSKQVDPTNERTLAVLTKLDLMDKGTDAKKVLAGEVIPMRLGIIGVVNRSQQDINNNKSVEDSIRDEKVFLEENYPRNENGSPYLAQRLNQLLMQHIKKTLPDLKKRIEKLLDENEKLLHSLGEAVPIDDDKKKWFLDDMINEFVTKFRSTVRDRSAEVDDVESDGDTDDQPFSVQLADINFRFSSEIQTMEKVDKDTLDKNIEKAIGRSVNVECFTSVEDTFKNLAKKRIKKLEKVCVTSAIAFYDKLYEIIGHCFVNERLYNLNAEIGSIVRKLLSDQLQKTRRSISKHIKIQRGMIFSRDETFLALLKLSKAELTETEEHDEVADEAVDAFLIAPVPENLRNGFSFKKKSNTTLRGASFPMGTMRDKSKCVPYVRELIQTYCGIVYKQIGDYMPKHILHYMFDQTLAKMKQSIREGTSGREKELVSEPEHIVHKREETEMMIESLHRASVLISSLEFST